LSQESGTGYGYSLKIAMFAGAYGSSMHGIRLAHRLLLQNKLPAIGKITNSTERFSKTQTLEAFKRADDADSLKVIINWD